MKRVKLESLTSKNPLFESWLREWRDAAKEKGSEGHHTYNRALKALQKYPLVLKTGKECILLDNFGKKTCDMIDKKLLEYKKNFTEDEWRKKTGEDTNPFSSVFSSAPPCSPPSFVNHSARPAPVTASASATSVTTPQKSKNAAVKSKGSFVPQFRSGSYGLLLGLLSEPNGGLTKAKLLVAAQAHCDASYTKAPPGSHYTAWASMAILIKKNLVIKEGKPILFTLTEAGRDLALQLEGELFSAPTPPVSPRRNFGAETLGDSDDPPRKRKQTASLDTFSQNIDDFGSNGTPSSYLSQNGVSQATPPTTASVNEIAKKSTAKTGLSSQDYSQCGGTVPIGLSQLPYNSSTDSIGVAKNSIESVEADEEPHDTAFLFPRQFKIVLLVDIHETEQSCNRKRVDGTLQKLLEKNIVAETRHLAVGDFTWVARDSSGFELVLPYVVERKRMDDLAFSIKDGRFNEQKFRLRGSGIPEVIYLIEKYGSHSYGLPLLTLQQATTNTEVVDQFNVKVTQNADDSVRYLACFTKQIIRIFKDKTLMSCPKKLLPAELDITSALLSLMTFKQFNKDSTKMRRWTVKDMLLKQLVQMKNLSVDKASAIVERYPTPSALMTAMQMPGSEKEIADLSYSVHRRIGPSIAKSVHQLYTLNFLP